MQHIKNRKRSTRPFSMLLFLLIVILFTQILPVSAQVASPFQMGHYIPGIYGLRDVMYPPPGLFVLWYNYYTWSDTYIGRNGNEITNIGPNENLAIKPEIQGYLNAPFVAFFKKIPALGEDAVYIAAISPNYMVAEYKVTKKLTTKGNPVIPPQEFEDVVEGRVTGWSDILVAPIGLSWAWGKFDGTGLFSEMRASDEEMAAVGMPPQRRFNLILLYMFAAPTGRYEVGETDNIVLGFWTHIFQGFGYYYPFEPQSTAIVLGTTLELNGKKKGEDITPGSRLSLEYGISQFLTPWFEVQVALTHNWQISDDTGSDVWWDGSIYDRKSSMQFSLNFMPIMGKLYIITKYGFDFGIEQRFKNENLGLNIFFATGLLTGK